MWWRIFSGPGVKFEAHLTFLRTYMIISFKDRIDFQWKL